MATWMQQKNAQMPPRKLQAPLLPRGLDPEMRKYFCGTFHDAVHTALFSANSTLYRPLASPPGTVAQRFLTCGDAGWRYQTLKCSRKWLCFGSQLGTPSIVKSIP